MRGPCRLSARFVPSSQPANRFSPRPFSQGASAHAALATRQVADGGTEFVNQGYEIASRHGRYVQKLNEIWTLLRRLKAPDEYLGAPQPSRELALRKPRLLTHPNEETCEGRVFRALRDLDRQCL